MVVISKFQLFVEVWILLEFLIFSDFLNVNNCFNILTSLIKLFYDFCYKDDIQEREFKDIEQFRKVVVFYVVKLGVLMIKVYLYVKGVGF